MPLSAQLVIALDSANNLICETVGQNGQRRKIDLPFDFRQRNPEIIAALLERQSEIKHKELAALRETQNNNISYVAENHPSILHKVWGTNAKIFSETYRKHLHGERGNLTSSILTEPKAKKPPTSNPVPNLDIEI